MGRRDDDFVDETQAEQAFYQALQVERPSAEPLFSPDLIARTMQRLPSSPPSDLARRELAGKRRLKIVWLLLAIPLLLVAAWNIWSVAGQGPQMAFFFGDGNTGLSAVLLGLQLGVKPLWNSLRALGPVWLVGGPVLAFFAAMACWWLLRRTRLFGVMEDIR